MKEMRLIKGIENQTRAYYITQDGEIYVKNKGTGEIKRKNAEVRIKGNYLWGGIDTEVRGVRKHFLVGRLVLLTWGDKTEEEVKTAKLVTRHLDGDTSHNSLDNLAWGTPAENVADMVRHGHAGRGAVFGERNGRSKLTEAIVRQIRKEASYGFSPTDIKLKLNLLVHTETIRKVILNKIWQSVKMYDSICLHY